MVNNCKVARFDSKQETVGFTEGETVEQVITRAGFSVGTGEFVNDDDDKQVSLTDKAETDENYWIVKNTKNA